MWVGFVFFFILHPFIILPLTLAGGRGRVMDAVDRKLDPQREEA